MCAASAGVKVCERWLNQARSGCASVSHAPSGVPSEFRRLRLWIKRRADKAPATTEKLASCSSPPPAELRKTRSDKERTNRDQRCVAAALRPKETGSDGRAL